MEQENKYYIDFTNRKNGNKYEVTEQDQKAFYEAEAVRKSNLEKYDITANTLFNILHQAQENGAPLEAMEIIYNLGFRSGMNYQEKE